MTLGCVYHDLFVSWAFNSALTPSTMASPGMGRGKERSGGGEE